MSAAPKWADDASCFFCIPGRPCREHAVIPFRQRLQDAGIIKDKPPHNPAAPPAGTPNQAYAVATLNRLAGEVAMTPAGAINDTLNPKAVRAYRVADAHGLDRQIVTDTLQEAVIRAGGTDRAKDASTFRSAQSFADKCGPAHKDPGGHTGHNATDFGYGPSTDSDTTPGGDSQDGHSWRPVDLGPYLRGEIVMPEPGLGMTRTDGQFMLYGGRQHAVIGETEAGKSWFALGCGAREIRMGNHVVYIHFEEGDPVSTIERLRLLGLNDRDIAEYLHFAGPTQPVRDGWLDELLITKPTLVVLDGVNEAMALHGAGQDTEGSHLFRKRLVRPCLAAGAATLECDHLPKANGGAQSRDAYGTVGKGNSLDGARFVMINKEPFGRGRCGVSQVYVTKDRPGCLRVHGKPTQTPGVTFMGTFVVDDDPTKAPDPRIDFYAPKDRPEPGADGASGDGGGVLAALAGAVCDVLAGQEGRKVGSTKALKALLRTAEIPFRDTALLDAVEDLLLAGRLVRVPGPRGATGYQLNRPVPSPVTRKGISGD